MPESLEKEDELNKKNDFTTKVKSRFSHFKMEQHKDNLGSVEGEIKEVDEDDEGKDEESMEEKPQNDPHLIIKASEVAEEERKLKEYIEISKRRRTELY